MTYLGTFWLGVLCGLVGGGIVFGLVRWVWHRQTLIRITSVWRGWSQTQGDE